MVKVKKDLTGMVFGRLTVLEQVEDYISPQGVHRAMWLCQCECGKTTIVIWKRMNIVGVIIFQLLGFHIGNMIIYQ